VGRVSFADLELLRQGARLEPLLQAICDFLDKQPALVERVRRDLVRGLKQPDHLTAPQVLRPLVLMRVKNWAYRELRERIADGITLRAFTNFYCEEVPKHDAFNRSFNRLTPATRPPPMMVLAPPCGLPRSIAARTDGATGRSISPTLCRNAAQRSAGRFWSRSAEGVAGQILKVQQTVLGEQVEAFCD
jgi:hypothetical protein